jgi:hypothetical protein
MRKCTLVLWSNHSKTIRTGDVKVPLGEANKGNRAAAATPNTTGKWCRPPPPPPLDLERWRVSSKVRRAHDLALGIGTEGKCAAAPRRGAPTPRLDIACAPSSPSTSSAHVPPRRAREVLQLERKRPPQRCCRTPSRASICPRAMDAADSTNHSALSTSSRHQELNRAGDALPCSSACLARSSSTAAGQESRAEVGVDGSPRPWDLR